MIKTFSIFLFCGVLLLSSCGIFATKPVETQPPTAIANPLEKLHADIDAVLQDALFTTASIGIKVVSVETGEVVYGKNIHKLHHPASTMKLLTAATALAKLGSDYRFETTVYVDTAANAEVVENVYLKGRADPVLQPDDVVKLGDALLHTGIKSIRATSSLTKHILTLFERARAGCGTIGRFTSVP